MIQHRQSKQSLPFNFEGYRGSFWCFYRVVRGPFDVTVAFVSTSKQSGFAELQMWRGLGLRLHATSCWHCSGAAMTLVRAWLRGGLGEGWRKMYVKIMCLQDALYKAIKLSVSKTVHSGYNLCLWQPKIHFSCLFHCELCQRVVSFVGVHWKKKKKKLWSSTPH